MANSNFLDQVAKTIEEKDKFEKNESFIFGISGKWGEGKTHFLDQLEEKLQDTYTIIRVNPWKFASDKTAFLRHFLEEVNKETGAKKDLKELYFDTTKNKIDKYWYFLWALPLLVLLICLIASYPENFKIANSWVYKEFARLSSSVFWLNLKKIKTLIFFAFSAVLLPPFLSLMTFQRKNPAVSTTDEFNKRLTKILENTDKKLLVYVDDLDRVTPKIAREVLDTLRTFFDIQEITFIVTGDHSVLERYIGADILPGKDESEQIEEGRRYLKKIFNIYWRMLPPIESKFNEFIDEYIGENYADELSRYLGDNLSQYKKYLLRFFSKNYRQVIRFIDFTVFTFRSVDAYHNDSEGTQKEFVGELLKEPLLLVKILLIQDLCNPLYERILESPEILQKLEETIGKGLTQDFEKQLENVSSKIFSANQKAICKKIFQDTERFYDGPSLRVKSLMPFLYLTADEGWNNDGGAKPEDFYALAQNSDASSVLRAILLSGNETLEACAKLSFEKLAEIANSAELEKPVRSIIGALIQLDLEHPSQSIFAKHFSNLDFLTYYNGLTPDADARMEFFQFIWGWLDKIWDKEWFAELKPVYTNKFVPIKYAQDFRRITDSEKGIASSVIICLWLIHYFNQAAPDRLDMIIKFIHRLDKETLKSKLSEIADQLSEGILQDTNLEAKSKRLEVVAHLRDEDKEKIKNLIFEKIRIFDREIVLWSLSSIDNGKALWSREEVEDILAEGILSIDGSTNFNAAFDLINLVQPKNTDKIWSNILDHHSEYFFNWLPHIRDVNYFNLSPTEEYAKRIYSGILDRIKNPHPNGGRNEDYFACLYPDKWMWQTYHNINKRFLLGIEKIVTKENIDNLKAIWNSSVQ